MQAPKVFATRPQGMQAKHGRFAQVRLLGNDMADALLAVPGQQQWSRDDDWNL